MLKITGLEITDFGRHKRIKKDIDGHVVGLTGPNGLGKSTVLQAIQFALTGSIDHPDALSKFIREEDSAKPPKKASVILDFEADGKKGRISRHITPTTSSREMTWEGCLDDKGVMRKLSSDKAVSEVLFQILGVDKKAINSTVFIKQGAIGDMFGTETERRDFYARLLMLGHLSKISDGVDTFRKQVAGTIQDLSAVKDAAQQNCETAGEFFLELDTQLQASQTWNDEIVASMRLHCLFCEQANAELEIEQAKTACAALVSDGSDPASVAQHTESVISTSEARIADISKQRLEWSAQAVQVSDARNALTHHKQQRDLADRLADTVRELSEARAALVGGNPSEEIKRIDQMLQDLHRMAELPDQLAEATQKATVAAAEAVRLEAGRSAFEEDWRKVTSERAVVVNDLNVRRKVLSDLQGNLNGSCGCPVCGSSTADFKFLEESIASLESQQKALDERRDKIAESGTAARNQLASAQSVQAVSEAAAKQLKADLIRLRLTLGSSPSAEALKVQRQELESKVAAFNVASAAVSRLGLQETQLKNQLRGTPLTFAEIQQLEVELEQLNAAFLPWNTELDGEEAGLKSVVETSKRTLEKLKWATSTMLEGNTRLARAEEDLGAKIVEIQKTLPRLAEFLSACGSAVTMEDALRISNEIREMQAAHDELIGKRNAANTSLLQAEAALNEVELKIAEQGHRNKLVQDLSRIRDAFKPSGITMEFLDYKFGKIAEIAADYLAESNADFMVTASTDSPLSYDFIRLKPGEKWLSQNRLSGGQRIRLAVATLRAIHSLIMPDVGLLVLDEPTTHLDSEATAAMAEMLRRIGSEGTLQMIVCDHDPVLVDAFDSQINLE
jgi:DNA repair exonuclease SbcCD ATPase subunit